LLAFLKKFFSFCISQDLIESSPAQFVTRPGKEIKRDRVLSQAEIKALWQACDDFGVVGRATKLLLVTGQRRSEAGGLRWGELDLDKSEWTLRASRTKAGRPHVVPLTGLAKEIIGNERVMVFGNRRAAQEVPAEHVFSAGVVDRPIGSWGAFKTDLHKRMSEILGQDIEDWRIHDLRRTCATGMAALGVDRLVITKILNHAEPGVTAIYDTFGRMEDRRRALELWEQRIRHIINPPGDNVVAFAGAVREGVTAS
jgi:integrase